MAPKRKRRTSPPPKGLAAGEQLKRAKLAACESSAWGWVDTEVSEASQITLEHHLMTCGLSKRNNNPFCGNRHLPRPPKSSPASPVEIRTTVANGELENDVIVVSDDELPPCNKKACKNNPNCLNYLGQQQWEDEATARQLFIKASNLGPNPILSSRDPELPVGLKNLGATCYANAFIQVWFRDLAFRRGVYQCQPSYTENGLEDSPVFQLQVTFAALQESTQNVYNPVKFAESLKLSTSEQQDAQEFSKLFMSHLDNEFQKQLTPSLRTLISDQFQGELVYGTLCHNCRSKSERTSDFLELEINIEARNNARLEDRIAALLQNEKLTGDNKYSCSSCARLQEATRYTELRSLPPVLHFSLLRFVYDFDSMERKKSKHNLLFPMVLDMSKFVKADKSESGDQGREGTSNVYELRGVLLHKGPSAYHGHYEAQVLDTTSKTWFQFDDEVVTKIDFLGEKRYTGKDIVDVLNDSGAKKSAGQPRARSAKKRRIDDSDDEGVELPPPTETKVSLPDKAPEGDVFSSRDAYMLIYARKEGQSVGHVPTPNLVENTPDPIPSSTFINSVSGPSIEPRNASDPNILIPPQRARDVVKTLNARHDEACELYSRREKEVKEHFTELRDWMRSVYMHWHVASVEEDAVVVSRQTLENWLAKPLVKLEEHKSRSQSVSGEAEIEILPTPDILCGHGRLHPLKASHMKRMSKKAYEKLSLRENIGSVHGPQEVCDICVRESFTERLYQIEHPRLVAQFDETCDVQHGEPGYWISKAWLKGIPIYFITINSRHSKGHSPVRVAHIAWRVQKPRMHVPLHGDPSPDSAEFRGHVRCEHDQLSLVSTARRSISSQACETLKKLFPDWVPLSTNEEPCVICEASIHSSKEDKRELRKKAEDEKARLRHMHDNALIGNTLLLENIPCAVLPVEFVRMWRKWLSRPAEIPRPDRVDTSQLFCQHDKLVFDPNAPNDWDNDVALIQMSEWLILQELYSCGPAVAIEKRFVEDSAGVLDAKFVHDMPVCHDCRLKRRRDYSLTDITVRLLSSKPVTGGEYDEGSRGSQHAKQELGPRTTGGTRQSKRIRQGRDRREDTRLRISKLTTVKEIKVQLHESLKIPTICQRLFYKGQELQDNTLTVESLGVLMNDTLDLREEAENEDNLSNSPDGRATKRRKEEKGFGGTLLAASASYASLSGDTGTSSEGEGHEPTAKPCPACTFYNTSESIFCEVCGKRVADAA